jgi:hypothetical protein
MDKFDLGFNPQPQMVKKFYFLDYFYILLKSIETYSKEEDIFEAFKNYKHEFQLGESKYKKLTVEDTELSDKQLKRYLYTLQQVINESESYGLIKINTNVYELTSVGRKALSEYTKGKYHFNKYIFKLMEDKYLAFYHLVNLCYEANKPKNGLLTFPIYSPLKLGFEKVNITTSGHIVDYSNKLRITLEGDIKDITSKKISLVVEEKILLSELTEANLISGNKNAPYAVFNYNIIINKFRKFWLNYFLKNIYGYEYSFDTFNIWVERGKQLGIIHSSEFFPNVFGRVVYPTSIIVDNNVSGDFEEYFNYHNDKKLLIHKPIWTNEKVQNGFVKALIDCYFDLKGMRKTHFINLSDLREKVCYRMRIPSFVFDEFLENTYLMNLKGLLPIQISLEADRLPQETSAMYLKREPVLVNGKYKNIIAMDYKNKTNQS